MFWFLTLQKAVLLLVSTTHQIIKFIDVIVLGCCFRDYSFPRIFSRLSSSEVRLKQSWLFLISSLHPSINWATRFSSALRPRYSCCRSCSIIKGRRLIEASCKIHLVLLGHFDVSLWSLLLLVCVILSIPIIVNYRCRFIFPFHVLGHVTSELRWQIPLHYLSCRLLLIPTGRIIFRYLFFISRAKPLLSARFNRCHCLFHWKLGSYLSSCLTLGWLTRSGCASHDVLLEGARQFNTAWGIFLNHKKVAEDV